MIVTSQSANALSCTSGAWKIWSLSDGHVDMSADLLRRGPGLGKYALPGLSQQEPSLVRLSVNCFLLEGSGSHGVLIDCGAGGQWESSLGNLDAAMAEAGIDPSSIGVVALTHTHLDHLNGLITRDGRVAFANLSRIVIAHDAVAGFVGEPHRAFSAPACPGQGRRPFERSLVGTGDPGARAGPHGLRSRLGRGPRRVLRRPDPCSCRAVCSARTYLGLRSRSVHRPCDTDQPAARGFEYTGLAGRCAHGQAGHRQGSRRRLRIRVSADCLKPPLRRFPPSCWRCPCERPASDGNTGANCRG
jgi:hypothetical protein